MLAFLVTLIKVIAPWVAAAVVIHYLNVYNEKKHPEFYNSDNENNPKSLFENLEIGYPFELAFIMYVGLLFFLICLIGAYVDDQLNWFTGGIFGFFELLSIYAVLGTHVWKIWVKGDKIIYRSYIGIKHYYTFADITRITERLDGGYEFYSGKKKLFRIDNNLSDGAILAGKLQAKKIPCDKAGMTVDKFTLKTRGVYKAVSAMSVGFLDFLENGSREGLTGAELAGVEKADALLVSQKVEYDDVWDLRNVGDLLESGSKGGSGSFGIYSTKIDNKVRVIDKQELPSWLGKTFKDGNYRTVVTNEEIIVYRSFGHNAEAGGAFATSSPALNRVQTKIDSAILPEWKNTLRYEAEIVIPKGTTLNIGRVEEQFTMSGARLAGDADQFLLPENWDLNWIKSIREVKP